MTTQAERLPSWLVACEATDSGFVCTRNKRHGAAHQAFVDGSIVHQWTDDMPLDQRPAPTPTTIRQPEVTVDEPEFAKSDHRRQIEHLVNRIPLTLVSEHSTLDRIDLATSIIEQAELWRDELVKTARSIGESWTLIGQNTGMTKQAAHKRWGTKPSTKVDAETEPLW